MGGRRRVILHMGVPKTGTSALQVAFARNREVLAANGVHYPGSPTDARALQGSVTTGNGLRLLPAVTGDGTGVDAADTLARDLAAAGSSDVLYSAEGLIGFRPKLLEGLVRSIDVHDAEVHAVVLVRNRDGHAWSAYAQHVKRKGYRAGFPEFLSSTDSPYKLSWSQKLRALLEILGPGSVHVMHYESHRESLVQTFVSSVLGLDDDPRFETSTAPVNRSLTRREVDLVRYINTCLSSAVDRRGLDDLLQQQRPLGGGGLTVTAAERDIIEERFGAEVSWINAQFFPTHPAVRTMSPSTAIVDEQEQVPLSETERYLLDCVVTLMRTVNRRRDRPPYDSAAAD